MIELLAHIYSLSWVPAVGWALLVWCATATATGLVVGPMLDRNGERQ